MREPNYYSDGGLDRAAERRQDRAWLERTLAAPESKFYPVWRGKCAVTTEPRLTPISLSPALVGELGLMGEALLLGLADGAAQFCVDVTELGDPAAVAVPVDRFHDLRDIALSMGRREAALLAYGRGLVHWHRGHRFCGACGHPAGLERAGHLRKCRNPDCGRMNFPRTDPAVITLVTDGDRCLLARRGVWAENRRSTIAGFVEPGERLEDAVRRDPVVWLCSSTRSTRRLSGSLRKR